MRCVDGTVVIILMYKCNCYLHDIKTRNQIVLQGYIENCILLHIQTSKIVMEFSKMDL